MIIYNTQEQILNYRKHPFLSRSDLVFSKSGNSTRLLDKGSYFDFLITSSPEEKLREEEFFIIGAKRPTESIETICNKLIPYYQKELNIESISESQLNLLDKILEEKEFYPNLSKENRRNQFFKKSVDWWNVLRKIHDNPSLILIDKSEQEIAKSLEENLNSVFLNSLLEKYQNSESDLFFQKELYWNWQINENLYGCKALADIIIEKKSSGKIKKVIEIDIKTTQYKSLPEWYSMLHTHGYLIQKSFYRKGLENLYPDTIIEQYWLVVSTNFIRLIPVTELMNEAGLYGIEYIHYLKVNKKKIENVRKKKGVYDLFKSLELRQMNLNTQPYVYLSMEESNQLFIATEELDNDESS